MATLERTPSGSRIAFETQIEEEARLPLDRTDLAEVLGNLLENAARHAASRVRVGACSDAGGMSIVIEDDGEGIAPAQLTAVRQRGVRLDERGEGAGLGLAIVQDVLEAYGWRLELGRSDLGGTIAVAPKILPGPGSAAAPAALVSA